MVIPSRLEHQKIRISDNRKKTKKNKTLILGYFHRKCGFLWNRYRVQKIGQLTPSSFYFLSPKQLTTPILQKMWSFVENVPGTAIFGTVVSRVFKYAIYLSLTV